MWNPEDYAKNSDTQLKWAQELRSRLHLIGTEFVLDVGCGDGRITADFATALPLGKVFGVEVTNHNKNHRDTENTEFFVRLKIIHLTTKNESNSTDFRC